MRASHQARPKTLLAVVGAFPAGADTFWEFWDPADPGGSPYGGRIVNSYCHAWSCTPTFIIRQYLLENRKYIE